MTAVLVFVGAMVGAPVRYVTGRLVQSRHDSLFPWGTLSVNLAGCLILGALAGAGTALPSEVLNAAPSASSRDLAPCCSRTRPPRR